MALIRILFKQLQNYEVYASLTAGKMVATTFDWSMYAYSMDQEFATIYKALRSITRTFVAL